MDIIWLFICVGWPGCMDIGTKNAVPGATVAFGWPNQFLGCTISQHHVEVQVHGDVTMWVFQLEPQPGVNYGGTKNAMEHLGHHLGNTTI